MKLLSLTALIALLLSACASIGPDRGIAFVSKRATEATLRYHFEVRMRSASRPSLAEAKEQIESQVLHMFGPMERATSMAAPKEDHKISARVSSFEEIESGYWRIPYDYEGTIVLESGPRTQYQFLLPVTPAEIYARALRGSKNPCTDEHYQGEGDFWYFWSPAGWGPVDYYPRCKLRSNENGVIEEGEDFEIVTGAIERIDRSKTVYPEYDRLAKDNVIDVHVFYGKDEPKGSANPYKSKDINAATYLDTVKSLTDKRDGLGFSLRRWTEEEIRRIVPDGQLESPAFVEEAVKTYPSGLTVRVRLFFGQTGIDEGSGAFHYFLRDALKQSAVMVYNGHSGLGGHLDLRQIAATRGFRISPAKDRYQIYFFNSCTSYTYYNANYFLKKRKGGEKFADQKTSKDLDILANGLSTAFDVMHNSDMVLILAIDNYAYRKTWTSYQAIAKAIDSDNLFTVNGDEDNPTSRR